MHIAPSPRQRAPYSVYNGGVLVCRCPDLYALCRALDEINARNRAVREQHELRRAQAVRFGLWANVPNTPRVTVVDARGELREDLSTPYRIRYLYNRKTKGTPVLEDSIWDGEIRPRGKAVPGTGRRKRYSRGYLRYPGTQRDRRLGFPVKDEGEPEFRGERRAHTLPTFWDDIPRSAYKNRSWKRYRKTQWRAKG